MLLFFFKQKTAYEMRISDWRSTCALPISSACVAEACGGWTPKAIAMAAARASIRAAARHRLAMLNLSPISTRRSRPPPEDAFWGLHLLDGQARKNAPLGPGLLLSNWLTQAENRSEDRRDRKECVSTYRS